MSLALMPHLSHYRLGDGPVPLEDRVVVADRGYALDARRVAQHVGLSGSSPDLLLTVREWSDGEVTPTFKLQSFDRFRAGYASADDQPQYGYGLRGKVVYLVHNLTGDYTPQDLATKLGQIAFTAKYQGAEAVVVLAYTLNYSAQERGVHDVGHTRMQGEKDRKRYDGQAPLLAQHLIMLLNSGVDAIVTPHNHSPTDVYRWISTINDHYEPMSRAAVASGSTMRYQLKFAHVDLAPVLSAMLLQFGEKNFGLDLSDGGRNLVFMGPDAGIEYFVNAVHGTIGLPNASKAILNKVRAADGTNIEELVLASSYGLELSRGIDGMDVVVVDDVIRSAGTVRSNISAIRGNPAANLRVNIPGRPRKVLVYASRSNLEATALSVLQDPAIDHLVLTNADDRAVERLKPLAGCSQVLFINFVMAQAARALEEGKDPNDVLTTRYIQEHNLLYLWQHEGHPLHPRTGRGGIV